VVNSSPTNHFTCKNLGTLIGRGCKTSNTKREFCPLGGHKKTSITVDSTLSTSEDIIDTNEDGLKRESDDSKEKKGVESQDAPKDDNVILEENLEYKESLKEGGAKENLSSNSSEYDILQNLFAELKREEGDLPLKPKRKLMFDLKRAKKILDEYEALSPSPVDDGGCCKGKCLSF